MRSTIKYITLLLVLLLVASVGGVFAIWYYTEGSPDPKSDSVPIFLSEFVWAPEEILPENENLGEDYMNLLGSILENKNMGLNSGKGDTFLAAIRKNGVLHWDQNIQGGNLKHLKDFLTGGARELDFVMHYISDTEVHAYMFENDDVKSGLLNVTQIKVYKTILVYENGDWYGRESQLGYATLRYIPDTYHIGMIPDEWVRGNLPT